MSFPVMLVMMTISSEYGSGDGNVLSPDANTTGAVTFPSASYLCNVNLDILPSLYMVNNTEPSVPFALKSISSLFEVDASAIFELFESKLTNLGFST